MVEQADTTVSNTVVREDVRVQVSPGALITNRKKESPQLSTYVVDLNVRMTIRWPNADSAGEALQRAAQFVDDVYNDPADDEMLNEPTLPMILGVSLIGGEAEEMML